MAEPDSSPDSSRDDVAVALPVFVYHRRQRILSTNLDAPLEIGRQRDGEPGPPTRLDHSGGARVVVTPINDVEVSRSHLSIAPADQGQVLITNLSKTLPLRVSPNLMLSPGESTVAAPPALAQFGNFAVRVDPPEDEDELQLEGLPERTVPPGKKTDSAVLTMFSGGATFDESSLLRWVETVMGVFQSAATSHDFPEQAAFAVVRIVGLDTAAMLRCSSEGRWRIDALHSLLPDVDKNSWAPSQTLLARVREERRTFRHVPTVGTDTPRSLQDVSGLVAAPILDGSGKVIGALYGDRRSGSSSGRGPDITAFEAKIVELLATGIATGLARIKEEQEALAWRVKFEQHFTPLLAAQLERDPTLLEGRDANVTVLFADIRGFSQISERLGPERTMAWIQDTMGALSECVLAHDGVLVDYIGDELMAMWGAPVPQSDHAKLACLAARQMTEALPAINARWMDELGAPVQLGIGLNSGVARVGNTGSPQKFKYGPLGDVVNVASRTQGATKYLGADCLITESTLAALPDVVARRLARVRVVNIQHTVDLYQVVAAPPPDWQARCDQYDEALQALEREDLRQAHKLATKLARDFGADDAVSSLLSRIRAAQVPAHGTNTSIWELPGK